MTTRATDTAPSMESPQQASEPARGPVAGTALHRAGDAAGTRISQAPSPPPAPDPYGIDSSLAGAVLVTGAEASYTLRLPPLPPGAAQADEHPIAVTYGVPIYADDNKPTWQICTPTGTVLSEAWGDTFSKTWKDAGQFVLRVNARGKTYTRAETVRPIEAVSKEALARTTEVSYEKQRDARLAVLTMSELDPTGTGGPDASVRTDQPNPMTVPEQPQGQVGNYMLACPPAADAHRLHWYVSTPDAAYMSQPNHGGSPLVKVHGGAAFYAGSGASVRWTFAKSDRYDFTCYLSSDGRAPHVGGTIASVAGEYHQTVASKADVKQTEGVRREVAKALAQEGHDLGIEESLMQKMNPHTRMTLRAVLTTAADSKVVPLQLYLGSSADGKTTMLVDATANTTRSSYEGASQDEVFKKFDDGNDYPKGVIDLVVPGAQPQARHFKTRGSSKIGAAASTLGIVGGVALVALFIAGAPAWASLLIAAATMAPAAFLDAEDEMRKNNPDYRGVIIDALQLVEAGAILVRIGAGAAELETLTAKLASEKGVGAKAGSMAREELRQVGLYNLSDSGKTSSAWAQYIGGAGSMAMVEKTQVDAYEQVKYSNMSPEQKHWAYAMITYSALKAGYGFMSDTRKLIRGKADNFDSKVFKYAYYVDEATPNPASVYMRKIGESASSADDGGPGGDAGAIPTMITSFGPNVEECGRAPDMKSRMYRLLGPRSGKRIWYALPQRDELDIMSLDFFGYNLETLGPGVGTLSLDGEPLAGRKGYNLGGDVNVWFALMMPAVYDIVCVEEDSHGKPMSPVHRYQQTVTRIH